MSERLTSLQRVNFLFGQIKNHATADEAYAALEQYQLDLSELKKRERGEKSEINVMRALIGLPSVEAVMRSEKFSVEDMRGVDITVLLLDEQVPSVGVQVKSNDEDVRKFRDFASPSSEYRSDGDQVLAERGLIVLNGKAAVGEIQDNFMQGLERVIQAFQHRNKVA